jgi:tRNA(fMet)-specific endonuclease VapC
MNIFLDSSAIIELFRDNQKALKAIEEAEEVYTSTICAYEVLLGEEYMKHKGRASLMEKVQSFFEITATLPLTYLDSSRASVIAARLSAKGKKLDDFDILIAAQALEKNAVVLTKDIKHFEIIREETGLLIGKII